MTIISEQLDIWISKNMLFKSIDIPLSRQDDCFVSKTFTENNRTIAISGLRYGKMSQSNITKIDTDFNGRLTEVTVVFQFIKLVGKYKDGGSKLKKLVIELTKAKVFFNVELKFQGESTSIEGMQGRVKYGKALLRLYTPKRGLKVSACPIRKFVDHKLIHYVTKSLEPQLANLFKKFLIRYGPTMGKLNSRNNVAVSQMINMILDSKIAQMKTETKNGNYPIANNLELPFEKQILFFTYSGNVVLKEGYIGNFTTFKRVGRLAFYGNIGDKSNTVFIRISMADLYAYFKFVDINIMDLTVVHFGGVSGTPEHIVFDVGIDLSMSLMGYVLKVQEVVVIIRDIGSVHTNIKSLGKVIGMLASLTQKIITDLFHGIFVMLLEQAIQDILQATFGNKTINIMG